MFACFSAVLRAVEIPFLSIGFLEFGDENKLKVQHVYKDVRKYCIVNYADATNEILIQFNEISSDSSDPSELEEIIEYKGLRDMFAMKDIGKIRITLNVMKTVENYRKQWRHNNS